MTTATALTLEFAIRATGARHSGREVPVTPLSGVVVDSRRVHTGCLFVALPGAKHDGHDFVSDSFADGAAAALVSRAPEDCSWDDGPTLLLVKDTQKALEQLARAWRNAHECLVVGITGSVGKSTTKEVVASVLGRRMAVLKSEGNLNTEIGLPVNLLGLRPEHDAAVLEMGMYAQGDIRLLAELARPTIGVITNVQSSHLERLGSLERIADAKAELVESLPENGLAVLNADDHRVMAMRERTLAQCVSYGLSADADVQALDTASHGLRGVEFRLRHQSRFAHVHLPMLGLHSVHAALAAAAVGLAQQMDLDEVAEALYQVSATLRLLVAKGIRGARIIDDTYNANPESMLAALNLLSELDGRKIAVLGDMLELGPQEEPGHRKVGSRAALVVQRLVAVGPRAAIIADEARRSGLANDCVQSVERNDQAVDELRRHLKPGDNVLVKGSRGMQMEEIVQAIRVEG